MTPQQWDSIFLQMCNAYPAWKPTSGTSMVWFKQLGNNDPQSVMKAIESVGIELNSQFPPSLYQVTRKVRQIESPSEQVDDVWAKICKLKVEGLSPAAEFALNAVGGIRKIGLTNTAHLDWVKKDFIRAFEEFTERKICDPEYETKQHIQIANPEMKSLLAKVVDDKTF